MDKRNLIVGAGAISLAAVYLSLARDIPASSLDDPIGAAALPRLLGWCMLAIGALIAISALFAKSETVGNDEADVVEEAKVGSPFRPILLLANFGAYLLTAPLLGFITATTIAIVLTAATAGKRIAWDSIAIALGLSLFLWFFFAVILGTLQPTGPLERLILSGIH